MLRLRTSAQTRGVGSAILRVEVPSSVLPAALGSDLRATCGGSMTCQRNSSSTGAEFVFLLRDLTPVVPEDRSFGAGPRLRGVEVDFLGVFGNLLRAFLPLRPDTGGIELTVRWSAKWSDGPPVASGPKGGARSSTTSIRMLFYSVLFGSNRDRCIC